MCHRGEVVEIVHSEIGNAIYRRASYRSYSEIASQFPCRTFEQST